MYKYLILSIMAHIILIATIIWFAIIDIPSTPAFIDGFKVNQAITLASSADLPIKHSAPKKVANLVKEAQPLALTNESHGDYLPLSYDSGLINYNTPPYPKKSQHNKEEGEVIIRLLIDKNHTIKQRIIYKSSGYQSLDKSVLRSAKTWQVNPQQNKYRTNDTWVQISVNFILK